MIIEGSVVDGKYRILRPLGGGAMGKVFVAEKVTTHERFAVKFIHDYLVSDETYHARFEREVNALRGIRHPHVVAVYDWKLPERGRSGAAYIVMEYLTGESMQEALQHKEGMSLEEVMRTMMQVLDGMTTVHALGVIHRDLSPANIYLVGQRGAYRSAKILDFGLAKGEAAASSSDSDGSGVTQDGAVLGRAAYAAPEMFLGKDLDARADVFACGMIMFRALAGRFPYKETKTDLMWVERYSERNQDGRPYPSPRLYRPAIPAPVDQIVSLAIRKRPQERYQSAEEMHRDLIKVEQLLRLTPRLAPDVGDYRNMPAADPAGSTTRVAVPGMPEPTPTPDARTPLPGLGSSAPGSGPGRIRSPGSTSPRADGLEAGPKPSNRRIRLAAAALIGLGILSVVLALLLRGGSTPSPAAPDAGRLAAADTPPDDDAGTSPTAPPAPPDAGSAATDAAAPAARKVRINVAGLPDGATATVAGTLVADGSVLLDKGADPVPVKVVAPGYRPFESTLVPVEDTIFFVDMIALDTPPGTPDAGTTDAPTADTNVTPPTADAGPAPTRDDAGTPRRDSGTPRRDAGTTPPRDAGTGPARDAGTPRRDGGGPGIIIDYD